MNRFGWIFLDGFERGEGTNCTRRTASIQHGVEMKAAVNEVAAPIDWESWRLEIEGAAISCTATVLLATSGLEITPWYRATSAYTAAVKCWTLEEVKTHSESQSVRLTTKRSHTT